MIRDDVAYRHALAKLKDERIALEQQRAQLQEMGFEPKEIENVMAPLMSFYLQLLEEVQCYERFKRGDVSTIYNLNGLGRMLIATRIARGLSQEQLAELLRVHLSQVIRDEKNEYHGVTMSRAARILDVLGVQLQCSFSGPVHPFQNMSS